MDIIVHDQLISLMVSLAMIWIVLGGIATMLGGKKWAGQVWNAPFRLVGSIVGWVLGAARDIIAASIVGTFRGIRDGFRSRRGRPAGNGGRRDRDAA